MLTPKKGTTPTAPKIKPSRLESLLSATEALASEQVPTEDTMSAIDGRAPSISFSSGQGIETASTAAAGSATSPRIDRIRISDIRPSPFQPKGRPSVAAVADVRSAIAQSGSLETLASPEGGQWFRSLSPEAARLAELAYDIQQNGIKTPVEVRVAEDGKFECLSGHRRLTAALLAGLDTVPVLSAGELSAAAAAATVLRGNLHRENFTSWQEAVLVTEVQQRREADGYRDNVRTLGQVMGWSHGKANALLRIRKALRTELLARVATDAAVVEEALSGVSFRNLEKLANEPDEARRVDAVRALVGLDPHVKARRQAQRAYRHDPKPGGGFIIEVNGAVDGLSREDAGAVKSALEWQLSRIDTRLRTLGSPA